MNAETNTLPLGGNWRFASDPDDEGVENQWFARPLSFDQINLPGSMAENGKGDDVTLETQWTGRIRDTSFFTDDRYEKYRQPGNIKLPFWLTPVKHYMGAAWYQREIFIAEDWADKQITLYLERPHWTTEVWIDGKHFGSQASLSTPHQHLLGALDPGSHQLTIRVDNRMHVDVGEDAHSMSDHSQTNWNGIIGEIALLAKNSESIDNIQIYPADDNKSLRVNLKIVSSVGNPACKTAPAARLQLRIRDSHTGGLISDDLQVDANLEQPITHINATIPVKAAVAPWDEFNPALYELETSLFVDDRLLDRQITTFGFRHFEARGTRFFLNGKHIYLRGTLECCVFPLTGYPPTDKTAWTRILRIMKSHGLNHMRFHSWCPPKAAFQAADEEGIIFSVECASWATVGFDEKYEQWLYREADHILREYGNHPSFCMMLYGNEPYGFRASTFLAEFVDHFKQRDRRRLFSSGTAWPLIPENEFQVWANPRIQYWDQNLESRINARPPETTTDYSDYIVQYEAPVISHEVGQWCVYPNFEEIPKYGAVLSPGNLEIFQDFLEESGMGDQANDFLMASGKLQAMCY